MSDEFSDWKAEAEFWQKAHRELVQRIDDIAWGRGRPHPDGVFGKLLALHYGQTGGMKPSPRDRWELRQWFKKSRGEAGNDPKDQG